MHKIFFIEGLPGAGKTTLLSKLKGKYLTIDEILDMEKMLSMHNNFDQKFFINNDWAKMELALKNPKITFIDRGPLSTLLFNMAKFMLDKKHDVYNILKWYQKDIIPLVNASGSPFETIYLDVEPKLSLERKKEQENFYDPWRNLNSLAFIHSAYVLESKSNPKFHFIDKQDITKILVDIERFIYG